MNIEFNRRDFLKLVSILGLALFVDRLPAHSLDQPAQEQSRPNIIIILFDAMAARNLSLYGYPRETSPNLEKFASHALVYQVHRSAGTYTTPSSASLYTGTYPWTHHALTYGSGVLQRLSGRSLFRLLHGTYNQMAFTQNLFADTLLYQLGKDLDDHEKLDSFTTAGKVAFNKLFPHDAFYGTKSLDQFLFKTGQIHGSLFLSLINDIRGLVNEQISAEKMADTYPYGLPNLPALDHTYFALSQVMDGVIGLIGRLPSPSFAYFHFLSPHDPYKPTRQFFDYFNDNWAPPTKPTHGLSDGIPQDQLNSARRTYDQYVANTDSEFGRLAEYLESSGLLENSYVIVTSDHGELFERGTIGHGGPFAYESQIRIPLMVSTPGQQARQDIFAPTTNIDLLPTILNLTGLPIPDWAEGKVLPGLGGQEVPDRSIFSMDAKENSEFRQLKRGIFALVKGDTKLIHTIGYRDQYVDFYEFYDLKNDPEELENLFGVHPASKDLKAELDSRLNQANQPFP